MVTQTAAIPPISSQRLSALASNVSQSVSYALFKDQRFPSIAPSPQPMAQDTIIVNDSGVQMAYTDTGAPSQLPYITIVAIHGLCFSARSLHIISLGISFRD